MLVDGGWWIVESRRWIESNKSTGFYTRMVSKLNSLDLKEILNRFTLQSLLTLKRGSQRSKDGLAYQTFPNQEFWVKLVKEDYLHGLIALPVICQIIFSQF